MRQWDSWRKYIAEGGEGSWPRDAFEILLDGYDEEIERLRHKCSVRDRAYVCATCGKIISSYCPKCKRMWES